MMSDDDLKSILYRVSTLQNSDCFLKYHKTNTKHMYVLSQMQQQHNRGIVEMNALQNYLVTTKSSLFEQLYIILYKLRTNIQQNCGRQLQRFSVHTQQESITWTICVLHPIYCKVTIPPSLRTSFKRQI